MKGFFLISLIILIVVVLLLATASPVLVIELSSDPYIPLGNIITWIGLVAFPIAIYSGIYFIRKPKSVFLKLLKILLLIDIVLAALWFLVSFYLADNWSASFEGNEEFRGGIRASYYFWNYTYLVVGLPLLLLITYWIYRIIDIFRR